MLITRKSQYTNLSDLGIHQTAWFECVENQDHSGVVRILNIVDENHIETIGVNDSARYTVNLRELYRYEE